MVSFYVILLQKRLKTKRVHCDAMSFFETLTCEKQAKQPFRFVMQIYSSLLTWKENKPSN